MFWSSHVQIREDPSRKCNRDQIESDSYAVQKIVPPDLLAQIRGQIEGADDCQEQEEPFAVQKSPHGAIIGGKNLDCARDVWLWA